MTLNIKTFQKKAYQNESIAAFNAVADSYDRYAMVQHSIGQDLLHRIQLEDPHSILDIGCGTGIFSLGLSNRFPSAHIDAIDAADNMISHCKSTIQKPNLQFFHTHFLYDPVPNNYDLIVSNATFQWLTNHHIALARCAALLRNKGHIYLSLFGPKTFCELGDILQHNITSAPRLAAEAFPDKQTLTHLIQLFFSTVTIHSKTIYVQYPSLYDLLKTIKYTGTRGTPQLQQLWTPTTIQKLDHAYRQKFGTIYATYELYMIEGQR